ncbi:MAG: hypothetical protein ACYCV7_10960 [Acidimicrobiales bacterium]
MSRAVSLQVEGAEGDPAPDVTVGFLLLDVGSQHRVPPAGEIDPHARRALTFGSGPGLKEIDRTLHLSRHLIPDPVGRVRTDHRVLQGAEQLEEAGAGFPATGGVFGDQRNGKSR